MRRSFVFVVVMFSVWQVGCTTNDKEFIREHIVRDRKHQQEEAPNKLVLVTGRSLAAK